MTYFQQEARVNHLLPIDDGTAEPGCREEANVSTSATGSNELWNPPFVADLIDLEHFDE